MTTIENLLGQIATEAVDGSTHCIDRFTIAELREAQQESPELLSTPGRQVLIEEYEDEDLNLGPCPSFPFFCQ